MSWLLSLVFFHLLDMLVRVGVWRDVGCPMSRLAFEVYDLSVAQRVGECIFVWEYSNLVCPEPRVAQDDVATNCCIVEGDFLLDWGPDRGSICPEPLELKDEVDCALASG